MSTGDAEDEVDDEDVPRGRKRSVETETEASKGKKAREEEGH